MCRPLEQQPAPDQHVGSHSLLRSTVHGSQPESTPARSTVSSVPCNVQRTRWTTGALSLGRTVAE